MGKELKSRRNEATSRHIKSLHSVLQQRNLYEKKLKIVQAKLKCLNRDWREVRKLSGEEELMHGTLFLKSRFNRPHPIERRILADEAVVKCPEKSTRKSTRPNVPRAATYGNENEKAPSSKYDARGIDDSEEEDICSSYAETSEKKSHGLNTWLRTRLKLARKPASERKVKAKLTLSSNAPEHHNSIEEYDQDAEASDTNCKEPPQLANNRELGLLSGVKTGVAKLLTKMTHSKETKEKHVICIDENEHAKSDDDNKDEQEQLPAVPKKKKKLDELMFECPLCNRKFKENEINQHAFTCNGEAPNTTRKQSERLDKSMDFIPLKSDISTSKAACNSQTSGVNDYAEWKTACHKMDMGKAKPAETSQLKNLAAFSDSCFMDMCKESEKINKEPRMRNEHEKAALRQHNAKVNKQHKEMASWMSDDSDSQDANKTTTTLFHEYLKPEQLVQKKKKRKWRINPRKRPRPARLDDDDSMNDKDNGTERCYICSETFQTGAVYAAHVTNCLDKERIESVEKEKVLSNDIKVPMGSEGLHQRLGNRKSWAPYEKAAHNDDVNLNGNEATDNHNNNNEHVDGRAQRGEEAAVKTYKPIGKSSMFDFTNQFSSSKQSGKSQTKTYLKRKKRF